MVNPNIIVDEITESKTVVVEEQVGQKNYYIEGIFMQADVKNGNGRIYPKKVLTEAVNVYSQTHLQKNRGYGELGHPDTPGIHFDKVAILTQSLTEDGSNIIGRAKVIDTPSGRIVKTFIDEGVQLGVSSRGRGDIRSNIVQNGFRLVAAVDVVADPSAPDAFVTALVEGKQWVMENGILCEKDMDELREGVRKANKNHLKEAETHALLKFIQKLNQK